jgi:hypothetical protein
MQRANMDVPLALNDIRIHNGLKGNRKSSPFDRKADVDGLFALCGVEILKKSPRIGYFNNIPFIDE